MAFVADDPLAVEAAQLAYYANRFTTRDTSTESFLGKISRAEAQALWTIQKKLERVSVDSVPQRGAAYAALSNWANAIGLSNGAGGYGPLVAVAATGGVVTATGTPASTIPNGTAVVGGDGTTQFITVGLATIGGGGTASVNLNASTAGVAGNASAGAKLRFVSPPSGVQALLTVSTPLSGGSDIEAIDALLARILNRLQLPPKGGVANDYRTWLEIATDLTTGVKLAISRAYIYPRRAGTGSVDSVITQPGHDLTRGYGGVSTVATAGKAYLDTVRPVTVEGDAVYVPTMTSVQVVVRPTPMLATNAFEFDSTTGGPYTVASSTTNSLTLNANCADLDLQVNTNHKTPRIQVNVNGVSMPFVAKVLTYNAGTKVATLDTAFDIAPIAGDPVLAGSALVVPVATAVRDLVESLGPSRKSGYADPDDVWSDTLEIYQLTSVVMSVLDANGVPYLANMLTLPTINGSAIDVQAGDNLLNPPQLLYATRIQVSPS